MTAGNCGPSLAHLDGTAGEDLRYSLRRYAVGEPRNVEAEQHIAAHGIDVTHGVGSCDRAVGPGIVHHRRKEVGRLDQGARLVEAEDGCIVRLAESHQHIRIFFCREQPGQLAHDLR